MQLNELNESPLIDLHDFHQCKENTCTNIYGDFNTFIIYKKQLVTELII